MKREKEIRNFETLVSIDTSSRKIEGVIPYGSRSEDMGFYEYLDRGCFSKTLQESKDIRCLFDHNDSNILARTRNGSLRFEDREDGLHFFFDAPETTLGNDVLELVRSDLASGTSFGFIAIKDEWVGPNERHIREARLLEVSVLASLPAYPDSRVMARSLSESLKEKQLDDADYSAIQEEIEQLKSLLPKTEEPAHETVTEAEPVVQEATTPDDISDEQLEELFKRLREAEEKLNRSIHYEY